MVSMNYYRGWRVTYSNLWEVNEVYRAERNGIELTAGNRVQIERNVDAYLLHSQTRVLQEA